MVKPRGRHTARARPHLKQANRRVPQRSRRRRPGMSTIAWASVTKCPPRDWDMLSPWLTGRARTLPPTRPLSSDEYARGTRRRSSVFAIARSPSNSVFATGRKRRSGAVRIEKPPTDRNGQHTPIPRGGRHSSEWRHVRQAHRRLGQCYEMFPEESFSSAFALGWVRGAEAWMTSPHSRPALEDVTRRWVRGV